MKKINLVITTLVLLSVSISADTNASKTNVSKSKIEVTPPIEVEQPSKTVVIDGKKYRLSEPKPFGKMQGSYYQDILEEVKPNSLDIHTSDMLDANLNRIFASMNSECLHGDLIKHTFWDGKDESWNTMVACLYSSGLGFADIAYLAKPTRNHAWRKDVIVTGIYRGEKYKKHNPGK